MVRLLRLGGGFWVIGFVIVVVVLLAVAAAILGCLAETADKGRLVPAVLVWDATAPKRAKRADCCFFWNALPRLLLLSSAAMDVSMTP